ncbi:MAG: RNA 3'-terminal phosphate cyclase [Candidatus Micrarchaeota archaeon]
MIEINGGDGGGQVLRTALTLSCILQKPIRVVAIRSTRPKPGLQPQHLTCVNALKQICNAEVNGNKIGATELEFKPSAIASGKYNFDIGTAGAITLLAQCVLPVLLFGKKESEVEFTGGTHVSFSPPADYFAQVFLSTISKMDADTEFSVQRVGWFPVGGGKAKLIVKPSKLNGIEIKRSDMAPKVFVSSLFSKLPTHVGERLASAAASELKQFFPTVKAKEFPASCPGCCVFVNLNYSSCCAGFSSLGAIGKPAEKVGKEAAAKALEFHNSGASADERLADQLLLYAALAKGETTFTTPEITEHFKTNVETIAKFLQRKVKIEKQNTNFAVSII